MFEAECVYHIYNRANGFENLFKEKRNYSYFLERYVEFADPVAETYAYCLMPNHFHMMVRVRSEEEMVSNSGRETSQKFADLQGLQNLEGLSVAKAVKQKFSNFSNAYAKAYNSMYNRKGSLFQANMKKKEVADEDYFTRLILYIHNNPVKHGFVKSPYDWPYSSIHQLAGFQPAQNPKLLGSSEKAAVTQLVWRSGGV